MREEQFWNLWVNKMQFIFQCRQLDSTLLPVNCDWSVTFHFSVTVYLTLDVFAECESRVKEQSLLLLLLLFVLFCFVLFVKFHAVENVVHT